MLKRIVVLLFFVQVSFGQVKEGIELCFEYKRAVSAFTSDKEANEALEKILSVIGASKNFTLTPCDNIFNALAVTYKGERYILYDGEFVKKISELTNDWSSTFILAHEVGHHINGHTRDFLLSNVLDNQSLEDRRKEELEADKFAGFVLAKLGASLNQTIAAIDLMASNSDDRYSTHPNKNKRLESIRIGYQSAIPTTFTQSNPNKSPSSTSFSRWQKNNDNNDNPFALSKTEAFTIGSKKPSNSNNLSSPPKLTIEVENKNQYRITFSNLNIPIEGKWGDIYYAHRNYRDAYGTEWWQRKKIYIDKKELTEIGTAIEVGGWPDPFEFYPRGSYSYTRIENMIMPQIRRDTKNYQRTSPNSASEKINIEIIFDKNEPLKFEDYAKLTLKNPHSSLKSTLLKNTSSNTIESISLLHSFANNKERELINKMKKGSKMYIRFPNLVETSTYESEYFEADSFRGGSEYGYNYTEYVPLRKDFIYSSTENTKETYYEFSLSGSSRALDFIE